MNRSGPGIVGDPWRQGHSTVLGLFQAEAAPGYGKDTPAELEHCRKGFGARGRRKAITGEAICFGIKKEEFHYSGCRAV